MRFNHVPPIYFLHIPRTAGTSLRLWLETLFDRDDWLEAHEYPDVHGLESSQLRKYDFFSGHLCYEFAEQLRNARSDVAVITWLRDPVARQLSAFRYAAAHYDADAGKKPAARTFREWRVLDPVGFLETRQYPLLEANYQTRYLTRVWREQDGELKSFGKCLDRDDLTLAQRNLEGMGLVGITEEMSRSIALFCEHFDLPLLPGPATLNKTKQVDPRDDLEAARERIAALNEIDRSLYQDAKREFFERYTAMLARYGVSPGSVEAEMEALRPAFFERFNATSHKPRSLLSSSCDLSAGLITEGFGQRFQGGSTGRWVRWAGIPSEPILYLPFGAGGDLTLVLEFDNFADRAAIDSIAFYAGTVKLAATVRRGSRAAGRSSATFDVRLPGELRAAAYTQLRIVIPPPAIQPGANAPGSFCVSQIGVLGGIAGAASGDGRSE